MTDKSTDDPMVPNAPGWWRYYCGVVEVAIKHPRMDGTGPLLFRAHDGWFPVLPDSKHWGGQLVPRADLGAARAERPCGECLDRSGSFHTSKALCAEHASQVRAAHRARIAELEAKVVELKGAINRDRTGLAAALVEVADIARAYGWITDGEWSTVDPEARTMDTLRAEVGGLIAQVREAASSALQASGDLATACVRGEPLPAQTDMHDKRTADEARRAALREAADYFKAEGEALVFGPADGATKEEVALRIACGNTMCAAANRLREKAEAAT